MNEQLNNENEATVVDFFAFFIRYRVVIIVCTIILSAVLSFYQFTVSNSVEVVIIEHYYMDLPSDISNRLEFSMDNEISILFQENRLILSAISQYNSNNPDSAIVVENLDIIQSIRSQIQHRANINSIQIRTNNSELIEILFEELNNRIITELNNRFSTYQFTTQEINRGVEQYIANSNIQESIDSNTVPNTIDSYIQNNANLVIVENFISNISSIWVVEPFLFTESLSLISLLLSINGLVIVMGSFFASLVIAFIIQVFSNFLNAIRNNPSEMLKLQKALNPKQFNDTK